MSRNQSPDIVNAADDQQRIPIAFQNVFGHNFKFFVDLYNGCINLAAAPRIETVFFSEGISVADHLGQQLRDERPVSLHLTDIDFICQKSALLVDSFRKLGDFLITLLTARIVEISFERLPPGG